MGYILDSNDMNQVLETLKKEYLIYAPKVFCGGGRLSDTDCVRYAEINSVEEIIFDRKSDYSFKEVLLPVSETLFFFTEESVTEASARKKGAVIFVRSCDVHALERLDEMYLKNGAPDYYYQRLRERTLIVLMGCNSSDQTCFCVSMGTNKTDAYDLVVNKIAGKYEVDVKNRNLDSLFAERKTERADITPMYVTENQTTVHIPANLDQRIIKSSMWQEYNSRCINCGRCNFVCPTCTCFTMQDLYHDENGKMGERRRVWASCMVDGYTDVAGGGSYRKTNGERMRFKVLHKVYDYTKRTGHHMCVGCGRCDAICPEYISYSHCLNKLEAGMQEVIDHE